MPLNPSRTFIIRAHALELFISAASITIGVFLWVAMKDSNSGVNLLVGAALVVAGIILLVSATKTIFKYWMVLLLLLAALIAGFMALIFFGLSVLLISFVGWLWQANGTVVLRVEPPLAHKIKNKRPLEV
jgi:hypothetical protein